MCFQCNLFIVLRYSPLQFINTHSDFHSPTLGYADHAMQVDDLLVRQAELQEEEEQRLRSLFSSPSIASDESSDPAAATRRRQQQGSAVSDNRGNKTQTSFAEIAGGGGYFPTLGEALKLRPQQSQSHAVSTANYVSSNLWTRGAAPPAAAVAPQKSKKGNSLFSFG